MKRAASVPQQRSYKPPDARKGRERQWEKISAAIRPPGSESRKPEQKPAHMNVSGRRRNPR